MTELMQELEVALDAWKAVSLAVGQLRGAKDFRLPDKEWTTCAMRAVILAMAKLQTVLLSGLADGVEFDDSLAGCRKHTVKARCNRDFGLDDAWCQFEEQCVELLASARRGSERARGLMTAPFEPPQQQQPAQPAGRCPLCGDAEHLYVLASKGRMTTLRGGRSLNSASWF